ncbi:MAG TPA: prepilin-type N-terminal cleavage/methylation domain-containing protein [Verrucomicrobiae bacterium]|jgi:prepilin-type N-terminal cleavage/methylation domain-containing protein/prepilin-type processing-associated H-X9-DG protein
MNGHKSSQIGGWCRVEPGGLPGFTLIELLVVIAIIGILAAMLMPVLEKSKGRAQGIQCLNNMKQLATAWVMYGDDNNQRLALNWLIQSPWTSAPESWVTGNETTLDEATNVACIKNGRLYNYVKSPGVYVCPSLTGMAMVGVPANTLVRSVSMNGRMGGALPADVSTGGPIWDTSQMFGSNYPPIRAFSAIQGPAPVDALVFMDESLGSLDDCFFVVQLGSDITSWQNAPTARHGFGATMSFADGHVELWHWRNITTELDGDAPAIGDADLPRVQKIIGQ